jgi:hypothetical protein
MNLNSVLIGSEDPKPLVDYYTKLFGAPSGSEGGYTWWQVGTGGFTVSEHSEVKGKSAHPGRVIWNIETTDVKGDFEKLPRHPRCRWPRSPTPTTTTSSSSARCSGVERRAHRYRLNSPATTLIVIATTTVPNRYDM